MKKTLIILVLTFLVFFSINAQTKFNYEAQKKFIPKELGKVYLGIPFNEFAKQIDLKNVEVGDSRFDWLELKIAFEKGNISNFTVRIHGLTQDDKKQILSREKIKEKSESGFEYEREIERLLVDKIPAKGFVYAMYITFRSDFDLKNYVLETYGKDGNVRKADDEYHFYDIQWAKKTADGLDWLIRSFHDGETRSLNLFGRIKGTEWGNDD